MGRRGEVERFRLLEINKMTIGGRRGTDRQGKHGSPSRGWTV